MYQNILAIDEISFRDRKEKNEKSPQYILNNFNYYNPKLETDFYLKYFIRELLIDIDILEVPDFLNTQFENSKNQDTFLNILTYKILPSIDTIILNAQFSLSENGYFNKIELEDGFIETEGIVKNEKYEYHIFYHITAVKKIEADLKQRKVLITDFVEKFNHSEIVSEVPRLKWIGKPSHLAFIIRTLVDEGYIESPKQHNKEINVSELSRQILNSFSVDVGTTENTMKVYTTSENDKYIKLKQNFDNQGFYIPNSGFLG
jgi:hypothetical protein